MKPTVELQESTPIFYTKLSVNGVLRDTTAPLLTTKLYYAQLVCTALLKPSSPQKQTQKRLIQVPQQTTPRIVLMENGPQLKVLPNHTDAGTVKKVTSAQQIVETPPLQLWTPIPYVQMENTVLQEPEKLMLVLLVIIAQQELLIKFSVPLDLIMMKVINTKKLIV
jgi:hypothetical protein